MSPQPASERKAAEALFALGAAFVTGVALVRWFRPGVLFDPDRSWLGLWILVVLACLGAVAGTARAAAWLFRRFAALPVASRPERGLPLRRRTLAALALLAVVFGALLRAAWLADPPPLFADELSLVRPTLALEGAPGDFLPPWRAAPFGVPKPYGSVGVVYLEAFRLVLKTFGANAAGLRAMSVAGGIASLVTASLLARAFLPRGGGALAAIALAGLRWQLIMSSWGWNAVSVAPLLDLAALFLVRGRRTRRVRWTVAAGLAAGVAGHVYLAGWIGFVALVLFRAWPVRGPEGTGARCQATALFAGAFGAVVLPLFLLRGPADPPYFARVGSHNLLREFRLQKSAMPLFAAAEDALLAPWFVPEPQGWADLPGRSRLGLVLGAAVALALLRSLARPREPLSAFLLAHAATSLAAAVAQGTSGNPNGYRFAYLASPTAVAAAAGALAAVSVVPRRARRAASLGALGLFGVSSALGARDALVRWPVSRFRFDGFRAQETLVARAAERWRAYGLVGFEGLPPSLVLDAAPSVRLLDVPPPARPGTFRIRITPPRAAAREGERVVERVTDAWGREWATVRAARSAPPEQRDREPHPGSAVEEQVEDVHGAEAVARHQPLELLHEVRLREERRQPERQAREERDDPGLLSQRGRRPAAR